MDFRFDHPRRHALAADHPIDSVMVFDHAGRSVPVEADVAPYDPGQLSIFLPAPGPAAGRRTWHRCWDIRRRPRRS